MELVMDQRIIWDKSRLKEIDEAKSTIMSYKREGYEVLKADGTPMERFHPNLEEVLVKARKICKRVLKILTEQGDERVVWDKEKGLEAKQAKKDFIKFLDKKYKAYSVDVKGKKNRRIYEFDVDAEEILMIPPTSKG